MNESITRARQWIFKNAATAIKMENGFQFLWMQNERNINQVMISICVLFFANMSI